MLVYSNLIDSNLLNDHGSQLMLQVRDKICSKDDIVPYVCRLVSKPYGGPRMRS